MSEGVCAGENGSTDAISGTNAFRPSRRTVIAAAAWTVPVVIVGTAAPALAAASDPITIGNWGPLCKHTGSDGDDAFPSGTYHIESTWNSSFFGERWVTITSVTVNDKVYTDGITVIVSKPTGRRLLRPGEVPNPRGPGHPGPRALCSHRCCEQSHRCRGLQRLRQPVR